MPFNTIKNFYEKPYFLKINSVLLEQSPPLTSTYCIHTVDRTFSNLCYCYIFFPYKTNGQNEFLTDVHLSIYPTARRSRIESHRPHCNIFMSLSIIQVHVVEATTSMFGFVEYAHMIILCPCLPFWSLISSLNKCVKVATPELNLP